MPKPNMDQRAQIKEDEGGGGRKMPAGALAEKRSMKETKKKHALSCARERDTAATGSWDVDIQSQQTTGQLLSAHHHWAVVS